MIGSGLQFVYGAGRGLRLLGKRRLRILGQRVLHRILIVGRHWRVPRTAFNEVAAAQGLSCIA
jgi:hypothetical protein